MMATVSYFKSTLLRQGLILWLVVLIIGSQSCIKEKFDPGKVDTTIEFTPGVAAPIGFVYYRFDEMFAKLVNPDDIYTHPNGYLSVRSKYDLYSVDAKTRYPLVDERISTSIFNEGTLPIDLRDISWKVVLTDSLLNLKLNTYSSDKYEFDSIHVSSIILNVDVQTSLPVNGQLVISSPDIRKSGLPFSTSIPLDNRAHRVEIKDFSFSLTHSYPYWNELKLVYSLELENSDFVIPAGEKIVDVNLSLANLDYSAIFGYLGIFDLSLPNQTVKTNIFETIIDGTFHFTSPELKLLFKNSFGAPIRMSMSGMEITTEDHRTIPIYGDSLPSFENPRILAFPRINQVGATVYDSIVLTPENTNLFEALEQSPVNLNYNLIGRVNPDGKMHNNFITDSSGFATQVVFTVPFIGYTELLEIADTLQFDFSKLYDNPPEEIQKLSLRFTITNGFPVHLYTQGYFANEYHHILDSIFTDTDDERRVITAATDLTGDGKADPVDVDPIEIEFPKEKMDHIFRSKYLIISAKVHTTNSHLANPRKVGFYADYFFKANISAIADLKVESPK